MKTSLKIYLAACSVMAVLGSCNHEAVVEGVSANQKKEARTVTMQAKLGFDSRIAFEENETSLNLLWEENDGFSVMVGTAVQTPITFTLTEGAGTSTGMFEGNISCNDGDILYAVWPIMTGGMTGEHQCYWSMAGQKGVLDARYTFMVGSGVYNEGGNTTMSFRHMTAALRMHLELPVGVEKITKVEVLGEMLGHEGVWVNIDSGGLLLDSGTRNDGVTIENEFSVVDGAVDVVAYFFAWDWTYLKNAKVVVTSNTGKQYEGALVDGNLRPGKLYDTTVEMTENGSLVEGDNVTIEQKDFAAALKRILGEKVSLDNNGCAIISKEDAEKVTELRFADEDVITSMAGIENFTNLEILYFYNVSNSLTSLDITKNLKLKDLQLVFSQLTSLDISKNINLEGVLLVAMPLTNLNVSNNLKLKSLNCRECRIPALDITPLNNLTDLYCGGQQQNIDIYVTMTAAQKALWDTGWYNRWENTNVIPVVQEESETITIQNAELSTALQAVLGAEYVKLENGYAVLAKEFAESVERIDIPSRQYTITSLSGIEYFTNLKRLECPATGLTECDFSENTKLESVAVWGNSLRTLDLSKQSSLTDINCAQNKNLQTLNINENARLTHLIIDDTQLQSISIPNPGTIGQLAYSRTPLNLDLTQFKSLHTLFCSGNNLTSINLTSEQKLRLTNLECDSNSLTSLDLKEYPNLRTLKCYGNLIQALDITPLNNLQNLECGNQKNGIVLQLMLTDGQKTQWESNWKNKLSNGNVEFPTGPSVEPGNGNTGGNDFPIGGNF